MAVCTVTLDIGYGPDIPATTGHVKIGRIIRGDNGSMIVAAGRTSVALASPFATVQLEQGADYQFEERIPGGIFRYAHVPASSTASYSDLVDIDPATLDPEIGPGDPAWAIELDEAIASIQPTVDTAVEDAVEAHTPGIEMGYAERTTSPTNNTQTAPGANALIPGLVVTVVGKGRPVDIEFLAQSAAHSVANTPMVFYLEVNGSVTAAEAGSVVVASASTNVALGRAVVLRRRAVLTDGVSYTFKAGMYGTVAGTTAINTGTGAPPPAQLSVTSR